MSADKPAHEVLLTAVDPDTDWGEVKASCPACGYLGKFQDSYDALLHHASKFGGGPAPAMASACRGVSLRGRIV